MPQPEWKFVIGQSKNMVELGELTQAKSKSISLQLNRPGSASFSLPMDDELAPLIQPITSSLTVYRLSDRAPSAAAKVIWSGYVQTIDENIAQNTMSVNVIGWMERLQKRITRQRFSLTATDDSDIILQLINHANLTSNNGYAVPIVSGSFPNTPTWIGGMTTADNDAVYPDPVSGAIPYVAQTRDKVIEPFTVIGPEITALTELDNGCDIWMTPSTNRQLWVFRKRQRDQKQAVFGYNSGPSNIKELGRQFDSSVLVNYMLVSAGATVTPRFQDDSASQAAYGLIEEAETLSGEFEPTGSILQYRASSEVALRSVPRQIFSMTPFPYTVGSTIPEPFVDYDVGDKVYLSAKWGQRVNIQGLAMRVFGMSFTIDDNGNEIPQALQLSPQG